MIFCQNCIVLSKKWQNKDLHVLQAIFQQKWQDKNNDSLENYVDNIANCTDSECLDI